MRRLLLTLTACLLLAPTPAFAAEDDCPQAVRDVTGTQPTNAQIAVALHDAAVEHDVPEVLLRAIAYVESDWRQFVNGKPLFSTDGVCGVGIMQVTADGRPESEQVQLASDYVFNIREGAEILAQKWTVSLTTPPDGGTTDDPDVIENWYYALCLYNGCGSDPTYPTKVANVVADPFRYAPNFTALDPYWFTKPQDAKPDYDFPNAFQAQYSPQQQFVFYDHTNGDISESIEAPTHSLTATASPSTTYPAGVYGPDGPGVTCAQCGGWRLASGEGLIGRAHWTNTISGTASTMTWKPSLPRTGAYRVQAFVPSRAEGVARYSVDGLSRVVDQAPLNGWVSLGDHTLTHGDTVVLTDHAEPGDPTGVPIVGDAMAFSGVTALSLATGTRTVTYGSGTTLTARLTHAGVGLGGKQVRLYKRAVGTTSFTPVGTYTTASNGTVSITVRPSVTSEYTARFYSPDPAFTHAAVGVRRISVRPRIAASVSGRTISASVAPSHAGRRVYLQRLTDAGWQNVTSAILSSTSRASFTVARAGTYRVLLPAHTDHVTGTSASLRVT